MKRLLLLALTACTAAVDELPDAGQPCVEWGLPSPVGTLQPEALNEASGLAASRLHPGVLYTHNDSGGAPEVFALHRDGSLAGRFAIAGVENRDWEAIAAGPCPASTTRCLYLGDVGDNAAVHPSVRIIVVPEPADLLATTLEPLAVLSVTYDEGPRDCEALFVDDEGDVYLVEKLGSGRPHGVWLVKAESFAGTDAIAERVATLHTDSQGDTLITDADLHPTRPALLVRTYFSVQLFQGDSLSHALESDPEYVVGGEFGFEPQGEAIAWSADGASFFTTTETSVTAPTATVSEWACER